MYSERFMTIAVILQRNKKNKQMNRRAYTTKIWTQQDNNYGRFNVPLDTL